MHATAAGTARYRDRFTDAATQSFFRSAQGLALSSVGIGSYLGAMDAATDAGYRGAATQAVRGGINVLDTSLNYRHQASERNFGDAIAELLDSGGVARDEFLVCTKAGYLVPGAVPASLDPTSIAGGMHSMHPDFLADQIGRSLANLRLDTIDVFYLHNPETQLQHVPEGEFLRRVSLAFEALEQHAAAGRIQFYGMATWSGFRTRDPEPSIPLGKVAGIAADVGGAAHRFRFIQLPLNLAMLEAATLQREDAATTIEAAAALDISVIASASILQARLAAGLPDPVRKGLPGLATDAQRALQFTRSVPGVTTALVGMSNPAHVTENLAVAAVPPASLAAWLTSKA